MPPDIPGFQIDFGNQAAAAAVVHRNGFLGADTLYGKENLEFMCLRITQGDKPDGVYCFIIDITAVVMLLHGFT